MRYDALYKWACRLTSNSTDAEDLLQDCFVAFVTTNRDELIENVDGYLRRMLAYMLAGKRRMDARFNLTSGSFHVESPLNSSVLVAPKLLTVSPSNFMTLLQA